MAVFPHLSLLIKEENLSQQSLGHFLCIPLAQIKLGAYSLAEGKLEQYLSFPIYIVEIVCLCVCVCVCVFVVG